MVHYGASRFYEHSPNSDEFDAFEFLPPVETASGEIYEYELSKNAIPKFYGMVLPSQRNRLRGLYIRSKILGLDGVFNKGTSSYEAFIQKQLANEGRYFIMLSAFDLPLLKTGEKKVLWTTRYSIRSIGQSFDEAIKELNLVAGDYFGKNLKGLIHKRATDDSRVEIGELEVISEEETN